MQATKKTHVRYLILFMLFVVTTINYADRATISIAGSSLQKDLGIDAVTLGYIFSAFGWAYVLGQIPGGWLVDRVPPRILYTAALLLWSIATVMLGFAASFIALFVLRETLSPENRRAFTWKRANPIGAIRALIERGRRVPEDVSVIGYDDSPLGATYVPPLTSVPQNFIDAGVLLARTVRALIEGDEAVSETLPTHLVVRTT